MTKYKPRVIKHVAPSAYAKCLRNFTYAKWLRNASAQAQWPTQLLESSLLYKFHHFIIISTKNRSSNEGLGWDPQSQKSDKILVVTIYWNRKNNPKESVAGSTWHWSVAKRPFSKSSSNSTAESLAKTARRSLGLHSGLATRKKWSKSYPLKFGAPIFFSGKKHPGLRFNSWFFFRGSLRNLG